MFVCHAITSFRGGRIGRFEEGLPRWEASLSGVGGRAKSPGGEWLFCCRGEDCDVTAGGGLIVEFACWYRAHRSVLYVLLFCGFHSMISSSKKPVAPGSGVTS